MPPHTSYVLSHCNIFYIRMFTKSKISTKERFFSFVTSVKYFKRSIRMRHTIKEKENQLTKI